MLRKALSTLGGRRSLHISALKLGVPGAGYSDLLSSILQNELCLCVQQEKEETAQSSLTFTIPAGESRSISLEIGQLQKKPSLFKRLIASVVGKPSSGVALEKLSLVGPPPFESDLSSDSTVNLGICFVEAPELKLVLRDCAEARSNENPFGIERLKELVLASNEDDLDDYSDKLSSHFLPVRSIPNVWKTSEGGDTTSVRLVLSERQGVRSLVLKVKDVQAALAAARERGLVPSRVGNQVSIALPSLTDGDPAPLFDIRFSDVEEPDVFFAEPQEIDSGGQLEMKANMEMAKRSVSCRGAVSLGAFTMVQDRIRKSL